MILKSAVLEINQKKIIDNYKYLSSISKSNLTGATIKANAYGLGDIEIFKLLFNAGCRHFFVANLYEALKIVGPPKWSSEDIVFMEKLVAEVKPGAQMNLHKEIAYFNKGVDSFGQDDGELSWRIPLGRLNWAYPEEIPIHHWAWTALSGNKASNPGPIMVCEALALATVNLFKNPMIIEKAKNELIKKTQEIKLENPKLGAFETITKNPKAFWNGTWREP